MSRFRLTGKTKEISGELHFQIEREDGFGYYVDQVFLHVLENYHSPQLKESMKQFRVTDTQLEHMRLILKEAGLVCGELQ
jgi:hypothetical protein